MTSTDFEATVDRSTRVWSIDWIEEVVILFLLYIFVHRILVSAGLLGRRRSKGTAKANAPKVVEEEPAADGPPDEGEGEGVRRRGSFAGARQVKLPGPVAASGEAVPGVTDRRFTGQFGVVNPDRLFGFIHCSELTDFFAQGVYVDRKQLAGFRTRDRASFEVYINGKGLPQAKNIGAAEMPAQPEAAQQKHSMDQCGQGHVEEVVEYCGWQEEGWLGEAPAGSCIWTAEDWWNMGDAHCREQQQWAQWRMKLQAMRNRREASCSWWWGRPAPAGKGAWDEWHSWENSWRLTKDTMPKQECIWKPKAVPSKPQVVEE